MKSIAKLFRTAVFAVATAALAVAVAFPVTSCRAPAAASQTLLPQALGWAAVAAGGVHTVAVTAGGQLWAWGFNEFGQLGDGTNESRNLPTRIGSAGNWASVAAGTVHTLAVTTDGQLWAWGENERGQLGLGDNENRNEPVRVNLPDGTPANWVFVAADGAHSLAITADGQLWAWGENERGQLGLGDNISRNEPARVGTMSDWIFAATGDSHSFAITAAGELWAWGWNNFGQLGDGTWTDRNAPVRIGIGAATNWAYVAAGGAHSVAITVEGEIWAWGLNASGQLGDGTEVMRNAPVPAGAPAGVAWASVSAGGVYTIAITTEGEMWGWGNNELGQLADGTTDDRNLPVRVAQGAGTAAAGTAAARWMAVSADWAHTAAITATGELWLWGHNDFGQLGNGTWENSYEPTRIN
ncbi:MAG: hypothetical protein FWG66_11230 [Spirochaetes bacterium]|nr:hypothetical protein [Spirochaetota bacterium]